MYKLKEKEQNLLIDLIVASYCDSKVLYSRTQNRDPG